MRGVESHIAEQPAEWEGLRHLFRTIPSEQKTLCNKFEFQANTMRDYFLWGIE